jgi:radical SAM protein with 4Fe4S-binding SPASM domain
MKSFNEIHLFIDNCKGNCKHCFCKPNKKEKFDEIKRIFESMKNLAGEKKIYATNQTEKKVYNLLEKVGTDVIEMKDKYDLKFVDQIGNNNKILGFSLHGATQEIHDAICGKGNYEKTLLAINMARNIPEKYKRIYSVVHRLNYKDLEKLCVLVKNNGINNISLLRLSYMGNARNLPKEFFFDKDSLKDFFGILRDLKIKMSGEMNIDLIYKSWGAYSKPKLILDYYLKAIKKQHKYVCGGSRVKITINSGNKQVFPCNYTVTDSRFRIGRYTYDGKIIIERDTINRNDLLENIGDPCKNCKYLKYCGGHCRMIAISDYLLFKNKFDLNAGFSLCPISLGVSLPFSLKNKIKTLKFIHKELKNIAKSFIETKNTLKYSTPQKFN